MVELVLSRDPKKVNSKKGKEEDDSGSEKENNNGKSSKRRKKTWDDVARFARITFNTSSNRVSSLASNASPGKPATSLSYALDMMDPSKKKKGRVQSRVTVPKKVQSLQFLCMEIISKYIECVETFGNIPAEIQSGICSLLAKHRKLNAETLKLFLGSDVTSLSLSNCSGLHF